LKYTTDTRVHAETVPLTGTVRYIPIKRSFTRALKCYVHASTKCTENGLNALVQSQYSRPAFLNPFNTNGGRVQPWPFTRVVAKVGDVQHDAITDSLMAKFLWNTAHGTYNGGHFLSNEGSKEFISRACVCIDLNRSVSGDFKNQSGQTISTKFATDLAITLGNSRPIFTASDLTGDNTQLFTYERNLEIFVTHEQVLILRPTGNTVMN
jgi:hypothetical protein